MTASWDAMRKEARRLETDIESKLVEYSKLAATLQSTRPSFDTRPGTEDEALQRRPGQSRHAETLSQTDAMTADMDALLARLSEIVSSMRQSALPNTPGTTPAPSLQHTAQRHAEILHDYGQEFRKTRDAVLAVRDRTELLSAPETSKVRVAGAGETALYKERAAIAGATSGADAAIASGLSLKEDLERQRAMFASMVERMETMSEGLPAVHRLIGQIRRKKKRDVLIMAAVVSTLLFVTFSWKVLQ